VAEKFLDPVWSRHNLAERRFFEARQQGDVGVRSRCILKCTCRLMDSPPYGFSCFLNVAYLKQAAAVSAE
jgi:hypothetical protein